MIANGMCQRLCVCAPPCDRQFSTKDLHAIQAIADTPDLFTLIVASMCPGIFGHEMVKAGLCLGLFGGTPYVPQGYH